MNGVHTCVVDSQAMSDTKNGVGPAEPFQANREHLLEFLLDQTRLELAREKRKYAELEVVLRERELKATGDRLMASCTDGGQFVVTRAIDPATGMGERRLVRWSPPAAETPPPPNGASADEAEEKLGATIAAAGA